ncbi:MAG: hypothetical protein ACN2B6_07015 [Rickettsiales bacterium]
MTPLAQALDAIYESLHNDNEELDTHIKTLKTLLAANGTDTVEMDPTRLPQSNRQGKKVLQSYFKQRGVKVTFADAA